MILVVEDDAIEAMDIRRTLESWGYEVPETVSSGKDALKKVDDLKPDLILLDITLNDDMSGINVANQVKDNFDIPFIFLTAHSDDKTMKKAKAVGAHAYILKPFDSLELKNAIELALYHHKMEKRLKESEKKFQLLFERAPVPYQSLDEDGYLLDVNQAWLETLGYKREEVVGKWFGDFLAPHYIDHFKKNFPEFKAAGEICRVEFKMLRKDGDYIYVEFEGKIGLDEMGHFKQTHCVFKDVTEKKKTEKALEESEKSYRGLFNSINEAIYIQDEDGTFLDVNDQTSKSYGYHRDYFLGKTPDFLSAPGLNDMSQVKEYIKKAFDGQPQTFEFWAQAKDGNLLLKQVSLSNGSYFGKKVVIAISRDITKEKQIKNALKESESLLRGIFDNSPSGMAVYEVLNDGSSGKDYIIKEFNETSLKIEEKSIEDVIGKSLWDLRPNIDEYGLIGIFKKVWETGEPHHYPAKIYVDENYYNWYENYVFKIPSGEIVAIYNDVTDKKRYEESLKESEIYYRTIFENTGTATVIIEEDTTISLANTGFTKLSGYSKEEIEGKKKWTEFVVKEDISRMKKQHDLRRKDPEAASKSYDFKFIDRKGKIKNIHLFVDIFPDTKKSIASLLDVTQQKKDEKSLRVSEERLKLTLDAVNDGIWDWNITTGKAIFSPSYYTLLGYEPYEFPQTYDSWKKLVHPDDIEDAEEKIQKHITEGEGYSIEMRMRTKSGNWKWILARGKVVERDKDSSPVRMVGTHSDVTQRKNMETALKESEERFKALIYNSSDLIRILDENGLIIFDSPSSERILGYSSESLIGKSPLEFIHPDDRERVKNDLQEVYENRNPGIPTEFRIRKASGEYLPVESVSQNLFDVPGIEGIVSTTHPIKNRKEMEDALRESEEKYRTLFESDPDYTILLDVDGIIRDVNKSIVDLIGSSKEELLGKKLGDMDIIPSPEINQHINKIDLVAQGQQILPFEIKIIDKNSDKRSIEIYVAPIKKENQIIYVLVIGRDITDQKKASEEIKESLREKEILLQEIHHRVKNNMQIISSLLSLQTQYLDDEIALDVLKESQNRVKSMALVHEKLYQSEDLTRINISNYIENLVFDLFYSYGVDRTRVRPFISVEDIKVNIETAVPIGLIISELVSNALKHAFPQGKKGKLVVDLHSVGDEIELMIVDDGIGFPEDLDLNSTESLGMELVNSLVNQLDASIEFPEAKDTKFIIKFKELNYKKRI